MGKIREKTLTTGVNASIAGAHFFGKSLAPWSNWQLPLEVEKWSHGSRCGVRQ